MSVCFQFWCTVFFKIRLATHIASTCSVPDFMLFLEFYSFILALRPPPLSLNKLQVSCIFHHVTSGYLQVCDIINEVTEIFLPLYSQLGPGAASCRSPVSSRHFKDPPEG